MLQFISNIGSSLFHTFTSKFLLSFKYKSGITCGDCNHIALDFYIGSVNSSSIPFLKLFIGVIDSIHSLWPKNYKTNFTKFIFEFLNKFIALDFYKFAV